MSWRRWYEEESRKKDHPVTPKMICEILIRKIRLKFFIPFLVSRGGGPTFQRPVL
jgi:hypothetical protein